jgi:aspartate aminotransferase-like enzyme
MLPPGPLLHPPAYPADRYAPLADRLKRLLQTSGDVAFVQAEAIVALEAAAASLGREGMTALNIVTSPYGTWFGGWLRRAGAAVHDLAASPGRPIAIGAVEAALAALPAVDLVAVVHAESANGCRNPLEDIAGLARQRGALLLVDAVASFGGHPLPVDALGIDVAVVGPQKALGGSSGLSVVSVSERAWARMRPRDAAAPSVLSLREIKDLWLDAGRGALPGMPPPLEFWSLEAAVEAAEGEGIAHMIARHRQAARATRAALRALGPGPWIAEEEAASALVTTTPVPAGVTVSEVVAEATALGAAISPGVGAIAGRVVRLDHTGRRAAPAAVSANVGAYGAILARRGVPVDPGAAAEAIADAYEAQPPADVALAGRAGG